jgi:hypothetical protein
MKKIVIIFSVIVIVCLSCKKTLQKKDDPFPFENTKRTKLAMNYPKDNNGYYILPLDTSTNSNRFNIYAEASKLTPFYSYNKVSVMSVKFDCNAYWVLGTIDGDLAVHIPLYNPFSSLYSSPYFNTPLSVKNKTVILNQYANSIISVVQNTEIYLKEYFAGSLYKPADEYKPEDGMYWSKRIIGPIPKYFQGDTITIYSETNWEAGNYTYKHPGETKKLDSLKIIFR